MAEPELRQIIALLDRALEVFHSHSEEELSMPELKARLAVIGGQRLLAEELQRAVILARSPGA